MVNLEQSANTNTVIFREVTVDINATADTIGQKSNLALKGAQERLQTTSQRSTWTLASVIGLAVLLGVVGTVISINMIVKPIRQLSAAAKQLGEGDLSQRANVRAASEINTLANAFNTMGEQLQHTLSSLEQRVADRTSDLERRSGQLQAAAEVARDATTTRDLNELLNNAVNLIRDRFGFYHAGIFLIDPRREFAVLQAATGEAGRAMLERTHKLKVGESGIVGYVSGTGQPRVALDVGADAVHFRNPLLPKTRSEMGLPLKVGQRTIGVLDVQSQEAAAFSQDDITVLQTMADQLAVAIENARLFKESDENIRALETLYSQYSEQAWQRLRQTGQIVGYRYDRSGLTPLRADSQSQEGSGAPVSIPLRVRGRLIGALEVWPGGENWSETDNVLLQAISERVSQAMESARVFDEAQARAAREQTLNQFVARFARSLDLDSLLRTAVKELGQIPDVVEASIHIGPPEG
jgi:GAF domain-containing protein/HAMP domain-containing protein